VTELQAEVERLKKEMAAATSSAADQSATSEQIAKLEAETQKLKDKNNVSTRATQLCDIIQLLVSTRATQVCDIIQLLVSLWYLKYEGPNLARF